MMTTCPICNKRFIVPYTEFWVYKIGGLFYCSESCHSIAYYRHWKRIEEAKKKRRLKKVKEATPKNHYKVLTPEQKRQAIDIAIAGGNPYGYMEEHGSKNPKNLWWSIKHELKEKDPELFAKIPKKLPDRGKKVEVPEATLADAMKGMQDATDTFFDACKDAGLKIETPEAPKAPKITKPVSYDRFTVRAVEGVYGSYHFQDVSGKQWIDFDNKDMGDTLSLTVEQWREFIKEIQIAAQVLGVEL